MPVFCDKHIKMKNKEEYKKVIRERYENEKLNIEAKLVLIDYGNCVEKILENKNA